MRLFFTLLCLSFISFPVFAANEELKDTEINITTYELNMWKSNLERITAQYDNVLKTIYKSRKNLESNIGLLRSYYPYTKQYQPFAKPVLDEMTEYALLVDEVKDGFEANDALLAYRKILNKHLVNLDVLSFAITMSKIDVRFGDKTFLQKVENLMLEDLLRKVKTRGRNPDTAFNIISYGEETRILQEIGGVVKKSELYKVGNVFYNVHDIEFKDGSYTQIYMNVTSPIRSVLKNKALRDKEEKTTILQR